MRRAMACHGVISAGSRRNRLLHQAGDYAAFNFQPLPLRHRSRFPRLLEIMPFVGIGLNWSRASGGAISQFPLYGLRRETEFLGAICQVPWYALNFGTEPGLA